MKYKKQLTGEKAKSILSELEWSINTTDKLPSWGFEKEYPDPVGEKEYFYWRKNIIHPFLTGLHIIIEESMGGGFSGGTINVYCKVFDAFYAKTKEPKYRSEEIIYCCKKTERNLIDVLSWVE